MKNIKNEIAKLETKIGSSDIEKTIAEINKWVK